MMAPPPALFGPAGQGLSLATLYLVFTPSAKVRWWNRILTGRRFAHVFALREDCGHWLAFTPYLGHTDVVYLGHRPDLGPEPIAAALAPAGVTAILRARAWRRTDEIRAPLIFQPFTCVEQVKALIGLRGWWILTPWQLYRQAWLAALEGSGTIKRRRTMSEAVKAPFELVKSIFLGNKARTKAPAYASRKRPSSASSTRKERRA